MRLLDFSKNIYSQSGEDGVLAKVLETLGSRDGWCVEFGAWDGEHLSNTFNLIQNHNYSAVLIEGSQRRFEDLSRRFAGNANVTALNRLVGFCANDGLDKLLEGIPIPREFDLLSIDIDGNDYHVWKAVCSYVPKVVCIEYNPTIPTEVEFVQPADPKVNQGSSLQGLVRLGTQKGYHLVAVTSFNAIFVRSGYFARFGITDNSPSALREDTSYVTQVFCGYDGTIFFRGYGRLFWHDIPYSERLRPLPALFHRYPGNFGPFVQRLFRVYRKISRLLGSAL